MIRRCARFELVVGVLVVGSCAEQSAEPAQPGCAPDAVFGHAAADSPALYVAASCDDTLADGSLTSPFGTISAAISAAPAGAEIRIAAGEYAEAVEIGKSVTLVGPVDESRGIILKVPAEGAASIILKRPPPPAQSPVDIILQVPAPDALRASLKEPTSVAPFPDR